MSPAATTQKSRPSLRFDGFEDDWKVVRFESELIESKLGGNYANSEEPTQHPLIKMGNLGRGDMNVRKVEYIHDSETVDPKDEMKDGDLFFNTRNTLNLVGKVSIWRSELPRAYFNSNLMRITFPCNHFMNYRLNSFGGIRSLRRLATGTTSVAAIYTRDLSKMKITLPSLPEQQKIADFLTAVDGRIQQLSQKKALLQDYKKGVMQQLFTQVVRFKDDRGNDFPDWEEKKLGEICQITTGKLDANAMSPNGQYRFYTCAKDYLMIDNYAFDTEALLISGNGANVGYIHYYKGKFNAYQRTYVLDGFTEVINFVQFQLETKLRKRIQLESKAGNIPYIVMDTLTGMVLTMPSLPEQTKIADFLTAIDRKIESVAQQIEHTQTFKRGLLQQMFV